MALAPSPLSGAIHAQSNAMAARMTIRQIILQSQTTTADTLPMGGSSWGTITKSTPGAWPRLYIRRRGRLLLCRALPGLVNLNCGRYSRKGAGRMMAEPGTNAGKPEAGFARDKYPAAMQRALCFPRSDDYRKNTKKRLMHPKHPKALRGRSRRRLGIRPALATLL